MAPNNMRGLDNFIKELRECKYLLTVGRLREQEEKRVNLELANIRSKFQDDKLDGYSRRKYIAKLVYIYILGYQVDFGSKEILWLLTSRNSPEKSMGHLAVTILHENTLCIADAFLQCIHQDLDDMNEANNCLALHTISSICNRQIVAIFAQDVYKLATSSQLSKAVIKKAILCLNRFYNNFPELIPVHDWYGKLVLLIEQYDLSISHAAICICLSISLKEPDLMSECLPRAIQKLHKIAVDRDFSSDHEYHSVPNPWIQIKLLQLISQFSLDSEQKIKLCSILKKILNSKSLLTKSNSPSLQHDNALKAVLFEALKTIFKLELTALLSDAFEITSSLITSTDINSRYLALDVFTSSKSTPDSLMEQHFENIIQCLKDRDYSIRKKALELAFSLCDHQNYQLIINELLVYLFQAEYAIKDELVLRIAVLSENFRPNNTWYFETMLKLITCAGVADIMDPVVWHRLVQIISTDLKLQEFACLSLVEHLKSNEFNESLVQLAGYCLGEYGDSASIEPLQVFTLLQTTFELSLPKTKAILLNCYLKLCYKFPLKEYILPVFDRYRQSMDPELQERAQEYYNLISSEDQGLIAMVCERLPPQDFQESIVLTKLNKLIGINQQEPSPQPQFGLIPEPTVHKQFSDEELDLLEREKQVGSQTRHSPVHSHRSGDLLGLDKLEIQPLKNEFLHFVDCCTSSSAVLFENESIQIGFKAEFNGEFGRIELYFGNKTDWNFEDFQVSVGENSGISLELTSEPMSSVYGGVQYLQVYQIKSKGPFSEPSYLRVSFNQQDGVPLTIDSRLAVLMNRFISPVELEKQAFFSRWQQIGTEQNRQQVKLVHSIQRRFSAETLSELVKGLNFSILADIDPDADNLVLAGIYRCSSLGQVGCLVRIQSDFRSQTFEITTRTTNGAVSVNLISTFASLIQ